MIDVRITESDCTILGTAPNTVVPLRTGIIIAANGGVQIARDCGLGVNILVTTAHLCRDSMVLLPHEQKSIDSWKEFSIDSIWVDETNGPSSNFRRVAHRIGLNYHMVTGVNEIKRNEIVREATGLNLGKGDVHERVSTGFFALCLAVNSGARKITLAGLSVSGKGFHYKKWGDAPKYHGPADHRCLEALLQKYKHIDTTSRRLHEEFGIGLVE